MRNPARFPLKEGLHSRQAHADLPEQAIYEREVGREGFFGPASHIHHKHPPTGWVEWEGELRPRAMDLNQLKDLAMARSPFSAPVILHNAHCQYRFWHCNEPMTELARNADGDDLLFVHCGKGELFCDYGHMAVNEGDYIVIPRSTMWRLTPETPMQLLMIEATDDSYQLPEKGMVGQHAVFDPAMLEYPCINDTFLAQQDETTWRVDVKRHQRLSRITYPFNPLDAQGWHGDLTVMKINWRDIRPLMSHRYHLPPSAHTTFVAKRFVICTFVPRPIESDPGALKVPFYHSNDDFDEVLFYHAGDFFSRDNIEAGMVTFHPAGFTHGPHPKAFAAGQAHAKTFTDEVAVMLDTRDALQVTAAAESVENPDYVYSWRGQEENSMKLATYKNDSRDGQLMLVSRDLKLTCSAAPVAKTMQQLLDNWDELFEPLNERYQALCSGELLAEKFDAQKCHSPLPRAYHWADGSAYVNHVELVRRARGAEVPESFWHDPLMYQGGSDDFIGPYDDIEVPDESMGIDFEAEIAVVTADVPMGTADEHAGNFIKLLMLVNDVSLRGLIPGELAKGFGFYQSKPASSFAPVAVTPDELGDSWFDSKVHLPLLTHYNNELFGKPNAGVDMTFNFNELVAHAARTRNLGAGTIIGSGTVSNKQGTDHGSAIVHGGVGYSCIAEVRMIETIRDGQPSTAFMSNGDTVRIEMADNNGGSIFGAIEQRVKIKK